MMTRFAMEKSEGDQGGLASDVWRQRHRSMTTSTRRFFCRPSGLSAPSGFVFGATGRFFPYPWMAVLTGKDVWATSHACTARARCALRCWLYSSLPMASVWPSKFPDSPEGLDHRVGHPPVLRSHPLRVAVD